MSAIPEAMQRDRYADECRAAGVLDLYEQLLAKGNWPGAAAMYALQSAPGTRNTDRAFCQGQQHKMERMSPKNRARIQQIAARAGIDTRGKYYIGALGRYGDPAAWVTCAEDVITTAKAKKLKVEGVINYDASENDKPVVRTKLADDIVAEHVGQRLQADPALAAKVKKTPRKLKEVQEAVVASHGPRRQ